MGLNLQNASVVINCDLSWNPARLEQRIARAWRKHQTRPVTVVNLIAENTLEHAMLGTLASKMTLAEGVLDGTESFFASAKLKRGADANLVRLQQFLSIAPADKPAEKKAPPADPVLHFAERAAERAAEAPGQALGRAPGQALGQALGHCQEAILPADATPVLLTVLRDPTRAAGVSLLFHETDWRGHMPRLQVLDESTWTALQQLAESGLITFNTRATRHLTGEAPPQPRPALTPNNSSASPSSAPSPRRKRKSRTSSSPKTWPTRPSRIKRRRRKPWQLPSPSKATWPSQSNEVPQDVAGASRASPFGWQLCLRSLWRRKGLVARTEVSNPNLESRKQKATFLSPCRPSPSSHHPDLQRQTGHRTRH